MDWAPVAQVMGRGALARSGRDGGGFTVLEVLVALSIVSVVGLGLVGGAAADARAAASGGDQLRAAVLAEEIHTRLVTARLRAPTLSGNAEHPIVEAPGYTWSATVRPAVRAPGLVELTVVLSGPGGRTELISLARSRDLREPGP